MYQLTDREKWLCKEIVDCAYRVHNELGPGLLEKIYEVCFCHELEKKDLILTDKFIFRFIMMV
jgi:GxxExxY protein